MFRTDLLSIIRSLNTVYTAIGICHASYVDCLLGTLLTDSQHNLHDKYLLLCIQYWDSWWWIVDLSETYRVLHQNKFEKYCISLAFIIRIYHDPRSSECQIHSMMFTQQWNRLTTHFSERIPVITRRVIVYATENNETNILYLVSIF